MDKNRLEAEFRASVLKHNTTNKRYLLAVSGGVDSMVLLELFYRLRPSFQVAHCNFQLRAEQADLDEELVRMYCAKRTIPFHVVHFDVKSFKETGNYSTQMACRVLRYNWFDEIMTLNHLEVLVTAHHLDDNLETVLINLSRGSGLKGMSGMSVETHNIFRPLLRFTRDDIELYAKSEGVEWREDASNASDDYIRNKIRHHVSPILKTLHPEFNTNLVQTLDYLQQTNLLLENYIDSLRKELFIGDQEIRIKGDKLRELTPLSTYLHHLFRPFGFENVKELIKFLSADSSSEIQSSDYRLIKERQDLLLVKKQNTELREVDIKEDQIKINSLNLKFVQSKSRLNEAKETIDLDLINYPLRLRKSIIGDTFFPFGMKGQKKLLSKFFKDLKLNKLEKEAVWLLVDADDRIIWVVNYRLDERFRINELTKNYLNIIVC